MNPLRSIPRIGLIHLMATLGFSVLQLAAQGIPEPDLIMYGAVRIREGNIRLTVGTLRWEFQSATRTVMVSTPLTNINDQFSYLLRVPCETEIGTFIASSNVIRLLSAPTTYDRSRVAVITDRTNQAALISPAQAVLSLASQDRGHIERVDLEISIPCLDSDGNGLPDCWEQAFFGRIGVDPNADPDQDGMSNLAEYLAGTDPSDPDSLFKFISIEPASTNGPISTNGVIITWSSTTNKLYSLQRSFDLLTGFADIKTNIAATPTTNSYQDTTATGIGPYFYRLKLDR